MAQSALPSSFHRWLALLSLPGFALLALAPGCGGTSPSALCQKACDCQRECSDAELDQCVSFLEGAIDEADRAGCGSEFDDYLSCIDEGLDSCSTDVESRCASEARAVQSCAGGGGDDVDDAPPSSGTGDSSSSG